MISTNDTVLITGGTGFTGSVLVKYLCKQGVKVRVIARKSSNKQHLSDLPIEWYEGDVYDQDTVNKACDGVNYIFHLAAAYREAKINNDIYYKVHLESTKYLAKAALDNPEFKRFIHVSTVGVHGHIDKPPADENTEYKPGDIYQETKTDAEIWINTFSEQHKLPTTIIRPAAIYGPGDKRLLKLFKMAKLPIIPIIGYTKGLYHLIHVEDLVAFMIYSANHPKAKGNTYICGNQSATSIKEIITIIATYLKRSPKFIRIPASPVFFIAKLCETLCKVIGVEPPLYPRRVAFFTKDRSFSTQRMQDIGFKPQYNSKTGLENLCDWYQKKHWL